ncbi:MAG TPA: SAF domain-containing protein, partial [Acidimicrobiales bacterium]|nr:SAF domain-containing protein [Acidimicrobiales bacterium]
MATRQAARPQQRNGTGGAQNGLRAGTVQRQRNVPWMVLGVILVVGGALVFAALASSIGGRQSVLAMARAVPAGQVVGASDLVEVELASDGGNLRAIAAGDIDTVVGQTAALDLIQGTLVTRDHLGAGSGPGQGKAIIGLALEPGQVPSSELAPGDRVEVLDTGANPVAGERNQPRVLAAAKVSEVEKVETGSATGDVAVSLVVDKAEAPPIAAAAAQDRVTLV